MSRSNGTGAGTPVPISRSGSRNRLPVPRKHTLGRAIIEWLGTLTLSGGDLDGQKFTCWAVGTLLHPRHFFTTWQRGPEYR